MEIAVAFTGATLDDPTFKEVGLLTVESVGPVPDMLETFPRQQLADIGLGLRKILVGVELDRLDRAEVVDPLAGRRRFVEGYEHIDERVHMVFRQLTTRQDLGPEQLSIELAHDDHPVDDLTIAIKGDAAAVDGDRHSIDVDRRRQSPVECHLGAAVQLPELDGRVIQETEVDRLLELVNKSAGEKDRRDVGLEKPDLVNRIVIQRRF